MLRLFSLGTLAVLAGFLIQDHVVAGAKGGKIRWTHEKSGKAKWEKAIIVPAAKGKKPGIVALKVTYKAKELAEFFVIGDGNSDLDLFIRDAKGKEIVKDEDPAASQGGGSDLCVCRWRPEEEQEYTIIILNNDAFENVVVAGTN